MKNIIFGKTHFWALIFILLAPGFHINVIRHATGAESLDEPHISLEAENQPLGEVLDKITLDTGFQFRWDDQWSAHPVYASVKNVPLHRGLKLILQGLNHAIVYESNKSITILIYGEVDTRSTDSNPVRPFSSQIQDDQAESAPLPESSPEEADDLRGSDDNSEETDSSENTEDNSTENEESSNSENETNSEESETTGKELDSDSMDQNENTTDQNDRESAAEDASPESSQEQN
jgi:hypothetical protein